MVREKDTFAPKKDTTGSMLGTPAIGVKWQA